jgi:hypothetical protein
MALSHIELQSLLADMRVSRASIVGITNALNSLNADLQPIIRALTYVHEQLDHSVTVLEREVLAEQDSAGA